MAPPPPPPPPALAASHESSTPSFHRLLSCLSSSITPLLTSLLPSPPPPRHSHPPSFPPGYRFHDKDSDIWALHPDVARLNPPALTLPLPFKYYGQPFYKGYSWEKKV